MTLLSNLSIERKLEHPVKVVPVSILPLGMVNAHLLLSGEGCVVVDTGLPGSEIKIVKALNQHGHDVTDVDLIVVTHAHIDHAGAAAKLRDLSGAPILGHQGDLAHFERREPMTFCSTGWFGRVFLKTGAVTQPYDPFTPDILLEGDAQHSLDPFGIPGTIYATPGHTAGSISVVAHGHALVGDLAASGILLGGIVRKGRAKQPPFEDHAHQVGTELNRLVGVGAHHFYLGHGGPLQANEIMRHAEALMKKPSRG